jgi:hypothetical protein
MNNPLSQKFEALNLAQTELLLADVPALSLSRAAELRIRARVLQKAAPKSLSRAGIRRIFVPIAACLLAVVVFFTAFPKAALAVSEFFGRVFTPSRYMNEDPSTRTPVPSIDEALAAAAPADGDYTVTLMSDLTNPQQYIDFRKQNGYDPFTEENWGWLRAIRPEIAEVLYDGNQLIWNTNLYTTNEHVREFMEGFGVHSGSKLSVDALMGDVTYTVAGDPKVYPLNVSGHGITPIFDETTLASADHAVLYSDFYIDSAQPLPDGVLTITQNIRVCENDAMDYGATVAIITHTFTFDTTKGNTPSADGTETLIPLSGDAFLSFTNRGSDVPEATNDWSIETKKVSLDDINLQVAFEYLPTGIMVHITVPEKPESWTDDMLTGFLTITERNIYGEYTSPSLAADLYIDGVFVSEAPLPDSWAPNEATFLIPVFPDQYANMQSVVLKLTQMHYITLNGTNQQDGEIITFSISTGVCLDGVVEGTPLIDITVPIPKS